MESKMRARVMLGIVLLVVGLFVFIYGMNASKSFVEQVSNSLTGRYSDATSWYLIGGIAALAAGILLLLSGILGKKK
jgi:uncharacterized membrane protein HdeD (DUF308 family)